MTNTNTVIRSRAKEKHVFFWEISKKLGISDTTFTKKMRDEFSAKEKEKILNIIDQIAKEKE